MSRFYVIATAGRTIAVQGKAKRIGTSYAVLDAAHCHREVFSRYVGHRSPRGHVQGGPRRLAECEAEARRLNTMDAAA